MKQLWIVPLVFFTMISTVYALPTTHVVEADPGTWLGWPEATGYRYISDATDLSQSLVPAGSTVKEIRISFATPPTGLRGTDRFVVDVYNQSRCMNWIDRSCMPVKEYAYRVSSLSGPVVIKITDKWKWQEAGMMSVRVRALSNTWQTLPMNWVVSDPHVRITYTTP